MIDKRLFTMAAHLNSRQRLLRAIGGQEVDYIPCSFMSFTILRKRKQEDWYAVALEEMAMGLDPMLFIPTAPRAARAEHPDLRGLPVRFGEAVKTTEWKDGALLHRIYETPAGMLTARVHLSEDWPHGEHIPFVDDYQVPRAEKPLVAGPEDLPALAYLLTPPAPQDKAAFRQEAETARQFAKSEGVLLAGGWGIGLDMASWLCGLQDLMLLALEQPAFVDDLLEMIHQWNLARMKVVLSAPVDVFIRRAWYEGCDFITPRFYRQHILPRIQREADLAHEHGAKFGYICSSGATPMLDMYAASGMDLLLGVDPVQGTHTDMLLMKEKLGGTVALWGGVSAAVTVERGAEEQVRRAVQAAVAALGREGFILSPVDNLTVDEPRTWENIRVFIDEWKKNR
jgi:uroporphyrinogen-III decarboxylase